MQKLANALRKIRVFRALIRTQIVGWFATKRVMNDIRGAFDKTFYLGHSPDVGKSDMDPLEHFCRYGWRENRDPHPDFSVSYYLAEHPEIAQKGLNPFWHYVVNGQKEGRLAMHPRGDKIARLRHVAPLEVCASQGEKPIPEGEILTADQLTTIIAATYNPKQHRLVLSVGHDNYRQTTGGVQLCIQREAALAKQFNAVYLNIHPWQPLPRLVNLTQDPDPIMVLTLNDAQTGFCHMGDLVKAIRKNRNRFSDTQIVIHHLLGHAPEWIAKLVQAAGQKSCWLWLHDFFTLCPSYTLQRNDISYCAAPQLGSNACNLCKYGVERHAHLRRMDQFFDQLNVHVLAPSTIAKKFWQDHTGLKPASIKVIPHVKLTWQNTDQPIEAAPELPTIAFLGAATPTKGWDVFESLVRRYGGNGHFRFVFLGSLDPGIKNIEFTKIQVSAEKPDAMIRAIRENQVDFVIHWASLPETFSFSTYEAIAGMAFVITNPKSGNVANSVRKMRCGAVLKDVAELEEFLTSGRAQALLNRLRQSRHTKTNSYHLSNMAFSAIKWCETTPPKPIKEKVESLL